VSNRIDEIADRRVAINADVGDQLFGHEQVHAAILVRLIEEPGGKTGVPR